MISKTLGEIKEPHRLSPEEAENFRASIENIRKLSEARRNRVKGQKETRPKSDRK